MASLIPPTPTTTTKNTGISQNLQFDLSSQSENFFQFLVFLFPSSLYTYPIISIFPLYISHYFPFPFIHIPLFPSSLYTYPIIYLFPLYISHYLPLPFIHIPLFPSSLYTYPIMSLFPLYTLFPSSLYTYPFISLFPLYISHYFPFPFIHIPLFPFSELPFSHSLTPSHSPSPSFKRIIPIISGE